MLLCLWKSKYKVYLIRLIFMIVIIYDGDLYGISKRIDYMLNSTTSSGKRTGILAIGAHPDDIELGCGASSFILF